MIDDLIERLRAAEAVYQLAHETAEHIYRNRPDAGTALYEAYKNDHGSAVAARDRAESAVKSLRIEGLLVAVGQGHQAAQIIARAAADFRELPGYLKRALVPVGPVYDEQLGELPF